MSRVKNAEETVFLFSFSEFFRILSENFSDFRPKNVKNLSKQPYACPEDKFVAWNFFLKFWIVLDFLQKPLSWFSIIYLRVQSKNCGRNSFLIFLFRFFFGFWAKNFSDFRPKNFKKLSKLPSKCPEEQFVAWNFFLKFWIVLDFLHKPLAWFSKFYLRVQSKNCWRNSFLIFLFRIFFGFWAKNFSDFWPRNVKNLSKLPSTCPEEQFVAWIFFKFWIVSDFLQKPLARFSKFYLRVQIGNCGKKLFFFVFFPEFFQFLSEKFSDFWPNLRKVVKTTFCVSTGTTCGFKIF